MCRRIRVMTLKLVYIFLNNGWVSCQLSQLRFAVPPRRFYRGQIKSQYESWNNIQLVVKSFTWLIKYILATIINLNWMQSFSCILLIFHCFYWSILVDVQNLSKKWSSAGFLSEKLTVLCCQVHTVAELWFLSLQNINKAWKQKKIRNEKWNQIYKERWI